MHPHANQNADPFRDKSAKETAPIPVHEWGLGLTAQPAPPQGTNNAKAVGKDPLASRTSPAPMPTNMSTYSGTDSNALSAGGGASPPGPTGADLLPVEWRIIFRKESQQLKQHGTCRTLEDFLSWMRHEVLIPLTIVFNQEEEEQVRRRKVRADPVTSPLSYRERFLSRGLKKKRRRNQSLSSSRPFIQLFQKVAHSTLNHSSSTTATESRLTDEGGFRFYSPGFTTFADEVGSSGLLEVDQRKYVAYWSRFEDEYQHGKSQRVSGSLTKTELGLRLQEAGVVSGNSWLGPSEEEGEKKDTPLPTVDPDPLALLTWCSSAIPREKQEGLSSHMTLEELLALVAVFPRTAPRIWTLLSSLIQLFLSAVVITNSSGGSDESSEISIKSLKTLSEEVLRERGSATAMTSERIPICPAGATLLLHLALDVCTLAQQTEAFAAAATAASRPQIALGDPKSKSDFKTLAARVMMIMSLLEEASAQLKEEEDEKDDDEEEDEVVWGASSNTWLYWVRAYVLLSQAKLRDALGDFKSACRMYWLLYQYVRPELLAAINKKEGEAELEEDLKPLGAEAALRIHTYWRYGHQNEITQATNTLPMEGTDRKGVVVKTPCDHMSMKEVDNVTHILLSTQSTLKRAGAVASTKPPPATVINRPQLPFTPPTVMHRLAPSSHQQQQPCHPHLVMLEVSYRYNQEVSEGRASDRGAVNTCVQTFCDGPNSLYRSAVKEWLKVEKERRQELVRWEHRVGPKEGFF